MKYKYVVVQNTYFNGDATRTSFGIAIVEEYDGITTVLESMSDISMEKKAIEELVKYCNEQKLELMHFQDVIMDFLAAI